jgi:hypothetical protein
MTFSPEGNRCGDFKPGEDTMATVGIGGIIAAKVLARTGLPIALSAFAFLLILPIIAGFKLLVRRGGNS